MVCLHFNHKKEKERWVSKPSALIRIFFASACDVKWPYFIVRKFSWKGSILGSFGLRRTPIDQSLTVFHFVFTSDHRVRHHHGRIHQESPTTPYTANAEKHNTYRTASRTSPHVRAPNIPDTLIMKGGMNFNF